jgi:3-hydroxyacyl-[acyl-carrier-protein] dehydratase
MAKNGIAGMIDETGTSMPQLAIREIMGMLPHRYPMLLIDRVAPRTVANVITGHKCIARNEWWRRLPSGSNRCASMPRVLILEAMAQLAVILAVQILEVAGGELFFFAGIDDAQFEGDVRPGDQLVLEAKAQRIMRARGVGKFATSATVADKRIASATMIAAMRAA